MLVGSLQIGLECGTLIEDLRAVFLLSLIDLVKILRGLNIILLINADGTLTILFLYHLLSCRLPAEASHSTTNTRECIPNEFALSLVQVLDGAESVRAERRQILEELHF